ncbi:uncharacterized protein [Manis javanica]|uniref:uncharacterized protein n=1 Tax=Manis javanica TaxID=9974 RepID=UPI003C6D3117
MVRSAAATVSMFRVSEYHHHRRENTSIQDDEIRTPACPRGGRGTAGWAVSGAPRAGGRAESGVRAALAAELRREAGALGSQVVAEVAGAWRSRLRRRRGGPAASCSQRGLGVGPPGSQRPWQGGRVRPRDRARAERLRFPPAAALSASCGLLARCTGPASPPRVADPGLVPLTRPLLCVTGLPLAQLHGLGPGRLSGHPIGHHPSPPSNAEDTGTCAGQFAASRMRRNEIWFISGFNSRPDGYAFGGIWRKKHPNHEMGGMI